MIGDQVEAHKEFTGAFRQWFMRPDCCQRRLHELEYFADEMDIADSAVALLRDTK